MCVCGNGVYPTTPNVFQLALTSLLEPSTTVKRLVSAPSIKPAVRGGASLRLRWCPSCPCLSLPALTCPCALCQRALTTEKRLRYPLNLFMMPQRVYNYNRTRCGFKDGLMCFVYGLVRDYGGLWGITPRSAIPGSCEEPDGDEVPSIWRTGGILKVPFAVFLQMFQ